MIRKINKFNEETLTGKTHTNLRLYEGKNMEGLEGLEKIDITRVNYGLDILVQAIDEGLITDDKSVKVVKEFIQYIKNPKDNEGWHAVEDDYEKEYYRCVSFTLIPNNYDSLDSYINYDDAYVSFCFDYGAKKGDEFYLCLSANSSESKFYWNNIQLGGTTLGLDESGKFVVHIDKVESTWKLNTLFPGTDCEFKAYESRKSYDRNARTRKSFKEVKKLTHYEKEALDEATVVVDKLAKPYSKYLSKTPKIEEYDNGYPEWTFYVTFEKCKPSEEYDDYNLETVDIVVFVNLTISMGSIKVGDDVERTYDWLGGDVRGEHCKFPVVKNASSKSSDELENELTDFDASLHEKAITRKTHRKYN